MTEKTLWFCDSDGNTIVVIHRIQSHLSEQDVIDICNNFPSEIVDQIAYIDAVERLYINDETKNLLN